MIYAKPSTSLTVVFRAYLASDHVTPATGKTIAITISKNGGAFGNPNAGATNATELSSGFYKVTLDTTDTGTAGPLAVRGAVATVDDVGVMYYVGQSPADVTHLLGTAWLTPGTAGTPDVNTKLLGGTAQTGKDIGSLNLSSGKVLIQGTIDQFDDFVDAAGKVTINAAAVTAIWTDTTASDFTAALSIGKSIMNGVSLGTGLTVARATLVDTLTTYTGDTPQTGDSFARIGATGSGLTTLATAAALATVQADTDDIQTRLPAALTANGNMKSDVLRVNGTVQTAGDLAALINALQLYTTHVVARCTASGVPTTTSIPTSACSPSGAVADQFKGRIIIFDNDTATAALRGQATDITASSGAATPTFTCTALTTAPASGDTFTIV